MILSLIQIRVFNRRLFLLKEFVKKVNSSFSCNICYWIVSRAFGANINIVSMFLMWVGLVIGITTVTPETAGLFSVSVILFG